MYQHQHRAERPNSSEEDRQAYQNSFSATVHRFMVNNVESFNALSSIGGSDDLATSPQPPPNSRFYGDTLPLESAMGVPTRIREKRLVQILSPGDVVRGHVILKGHVLGVQITSLVASAKVRDFTGLDVRGMVQYENLSDDKTRCEAVMDEMQLDDVVQAVVINKRESHMELSFRTEHVSKLCPAGSIPKGLCMGYLDGERAVSNTEQPQSPAAFMEDLEELPGFANPSSSENLKGVLCVGGYDVKPKPSLMRAIQKAEYPKSEYFDSLRKAQRHKWSMDTVAIGVKHFKSGELGQAKKLLNHALDIDPSNVEGLVARGALLSNGGKYKEAIVDFETALTINHAHRNARKYLVETQVAYGKDLEQEGRLEGAVVCYREALADDPTQDTAKTRLEHLSKILQRKAAEKVERERQEAAERARLKRLHSIIEEEKEKKEKKKSKTTKKTKKRSKKPLKKKKKRKGVKRSSKHRRHSTDSEESLDSASSLSSPLHGRSKRRIRSRSVSSSPQRRSRRRETRSRSGSFSPYRRRKGTRSRSVSSSPKRRRRRRQTHSRSDSSSPYRRRRGTCSRSASSSPYRRSNTLSRSGTSSPQYRRRRRRNRSASSSPPRRGKKTRSRSASSSPQRRRRKARSRSVSFSPHQRRRRRQSVSRSASSSPHHGRSSVQERRRRTRSRSATLSGHNKTLTPPPHSLHGSAQLVETGQFSRHGLRSPSASRSRLKSSAEEGEKCSHSQLRSLAAREAGGNVSQSRPARSPPPPPPQGVGKYQLHSPVGEMVKLSRPRLHSSQRNCS